MTKIEWCDKTINPIVGCSKVSPGCDNCYAEKMACRLAHMNGQRAYQDVLDGDNDNWFRRWNGKTEFRPEVLKKIEKWKKPRRIFVGSMGDIFHESVDLMDLIRIFGYMNNYKHHTFLLLTKRPENALKFCYKAGLMPSGLPSPACHTPSGEVWPENVWLGVTAENQEMADKRIPVLLQIPAPVRFVSVEPMLRHIDLTHLLLKKSDKPERKKPDVTFNCLTGWYGGIDKHSPAKPAKLDWVICGGETGHKARPVHPEWVRSLRDQCKDAAVPFFFKQWGGYGPGSTLMSTGERTFRQFSNKLQWEHKGETWINGGTCVDMTGKILRCGGDFDTAEYPVAITHKLSKKRAGRELDGEIYEQFPEVS